MSEQTQIMVGGPLYLDKRPVSGKRDIRSAPAPPQLDPSRGGHCCCPDYADGWIVAAFFGGLLVGLVVAIVVGLVGVV